MTHVMKVAKTRDVKPAQITFRDREAVPVDLREDVSEEVREREEHDPSPNSFAPIRATLPAAMKLLQMSTVTKATISRS